MGSAVAKRTYFVKFIGLAMAERTYCRKFIGSAVAEGTYFMQNLTCRKYKGLNGQ